MNRKIGLTTTVPIEVILAAGDIPLDLNNLFITVENPGDLVRRAELDGLPASVCAWVKGIYSAALACGDIETIVAVTQGDCSNTHVLIELLRRKGRRVIPFAYPFDRDRSLLELQLERFMESFGVDETAVRQARKRLEGVRGKLTHLDEMAWREGRVGSLEQHQWLVSGSDMNGDPGRFETQLDTFLTEAGKRPAKQADIRLGYLGVPPIFSDLFDVVESFGAAVVFNEMGRQFAMLKSAGDIVEQYLSYTYPYDVAGRIADIGEEVKRRRIDGLIHYTQSFCFRQMEHPLLVEDVSVPVLWLEGDRPGPLDGRTRTRLESFVEMLLDRR